MAFPDDFSDVVVMKIHPAIGIARVAKGNEYFVFGTDPGTYKSNGLMKRQAVQYRVFAYGENHVGLGELTPSIMTLLGLTPVWSARVSNRKIAYVEQEPLSSDRHVISGAASSNDQNDGHLFGSLPDFAEGSRIPLGQITPDGVFIPPEAGVWRKRSGQRIPSFPSHTNEIADSSSDGAITCRLDGAPGNLPILPACIVVAPGDFSPDYGSEEARGSSLLKFIRNTIGPSNLPGPGNIHNQTARKLDEDALRSATSWFAPGFEVSFGNRGEVPDLGRLLYKSSENPLIDPREMRVRYRDSPSALGAVHGQLTSGCCSPWQTDFTACVGAWTEYLPTVAFLDEDARVQVEVHRKRYDDHSPFADTLVTGDDFERHVDRIGVVRIRNAQPIETERDPGDDI